MEQEMNNDVIEQIVMLSKTLNTDQLCCLISNICTMIDSKEYEEEEE